MSITLLKSRFGMSILLQHIFKTPFPKNSSRGLLLPLPDKEFEGYESRYFGRFSKQLKAHGFKEFFHQLIFSDVTNDFVQLILFSLYLLLSVSFAFLVLKVPELL